MHFKASLLITHNIENLLGEVWELSTFVHHLPADDPCVYSSDEHLSTATTLLPFTILQIPLCSGFFELKVTLDKYDR